MSMRFNSPTVAGAALAFIHSESNMTSFPFNLSRTNAEQAPRQDAHYESSPFFSTMPGQGHLSKQMCPSTFNLPWSSNTQGTCCFLIPVKVEGPTEPIMNIPMTPLEVKAPLEIEVIGVL